MLRVFAGSRRVVTEILQLPDWLKNIFNIVAVKAGKNLYCHGSGDPVPLERWTSTCVAYLILLMFCERLALAIIFVSFQVR